MSKTTVSDNRKKRIGRPPVGATLIGVRVPPNLLKSLNDWRRQQQDLPGRPEAIRRLVELGLKAKK